MLNQRSNWDLNVDQSWIWKLGAPAKVQFIIWLVSQNGLPTNSLRFVRGLANSSQCNRCSNTLEDPIHCLRDCLHSCDVWLRLGISQNPQFCAHQDVIIWIKEQSHSSKGSLFLAGLWWVWCWRNQAILGEESWSIELVTRKIMASHEEFLSFLKRNRKDDTRSLIPHWTPPPPDAVKLNMDGSYNPNSTDMSVGGLIRSNSGEWIVGLSAFEGSGDAFLAELIAVKKGLSLAWDEGHRRIWCESDSLDAIISLQHRDRRKYHKYTFVIEDILSLLKRQWHVEFEHIFRESNTCADFLAQHGTSQVERWMQGRTYLEANKGMGPYYAFYLF